MEYAVHRVDGEVEYVRDIKTGKNVSLKEFMEKQMESNEHLRNLYYIYYI